MVKKWIQMIQYKENSLVSEYGLAAGRDVGLGRPGPVAQLQEVAADLQHVGLQELEVPDQVGHHQVAAAADAAAAAAAHGAGGGGRADVVPLSGVHLAGDEGWGNGNMFE